MNVILYIQFNLNTWKNNNKWKDGDEKIHDISDKYIVRYNNENWSNWCDWGIGSNIYNYNISNWNTKESD